MNTANVIFYPNVIYVHDAGGSHPIRNHKKKSLFVPLGGEIGEGGGRMHVMCIYVWYAVGRTVVSPAHQSSNPRLDMGACIFLDLFQTFPQCAFSGEGTFPSTTKALW